MTSKIFKTLKIALKKLLKILNPPLSSSPKRENKKEDSKLFTADKTVMILGIIEFLNSI